MIYERLIGNLLRNNELASRVSLFVYGLDTQFFSRFLGATGGYASGDVKDLLVRLISGRAWYGDVTKFMAAKMPKYAVKGLMKLG